MGKTLPVLFLILLFGVGSALAVVQEKRSEEEIAKVAIGAYQDGFYEVAKEELEDFLITYPDSGYVSQIKLILLLTCLHLAECQEASLLWPEVGGETSLEKSGFSPAQLLFQLGICFFQELDFDQARQYFHKILQSYPRGRLASQARFFLIKMAFHQSKFDLAADNAKILFKMKDPQLSPGQNKELLYFSGLSYYRTGKYDAAMPLLTKYFNSYAVGMDQNAKIFYYKILTKVALQTSKLSSANHFLNLWLAEYPHSEGIVAALYLVGEANYKQQDLKKAYSYLQQLVLRADLAPEQQRIAYGYLVNILLTRKNQTELIGYLEKLIPLEAGLNEQKRHLKLLGTLYYDAKNYDKCMVFLSQLLQKSSKVGKDEDVLLMYINAGLVAGQCTDVVKTLSSRFDFSRLEKISPTLLEAGYSYGLCLEQEHLYADAFYGLQQIYKQNGNRECRIRILDAMNRISLKLGKREPFGSVAETIVQDFSLDNLEDEKLLKRHPHLVLAVATHFYQLHEYERAIPSLLWLQGLPAGKYPALHRQVLFFLAECYFHQEKFSEAIPVYEELVDGVPGRYRELAALRLATLYEQQGYQKKKAEIYRKLPEITGDSGLEKVLEKDK
ncbi:MAG: tetratricopeptide repeat protein [Xanthomonadaceae bacterium]|nr:tetratricopeptide repeat protein [Xanthomonadaceae bacterium]